MNNPRQITDSRDARHRPGLLGGLQLLRERLTRNLSPLAASLLMIPCLGFTACSSVVVPDERFSDVQQAIDDRLGRRVLWDQGRPEDQQADAAVQALLKRPLEPDDAVQIALFRNSTLQATFEDIGVAQADVVAAGQLRNPSIAGFIRFPNKAPRGVNWNLGVDAWLFDAFLIPIQTKLATAARDVAIQQVTGQILRLAAETRSAYFAVQGALRVRAMDADVLEAARIAYSLVDRQSALGHVDDLQLAEQLTLLQQAELASNESEAQAHLARERLRRDMGLAASADEWQIVEVMAAPLAEDPQEEDLLRVALASRADLAAARMDVERVRYGLTLAKKWWLSTVAVGVETEHGSDGQQQTGPHFGVELPIFNRREAELARQEAWIRQAVRRQESLEADVRSEVRMALERVRAARRAAEFQRDGVLPVRRDVLSSFQRRYNSMFTGIFEVLRARSDLASAEAQYARALQEYWTAQSDLELAVGRRISLSSDASSTQHPSEHASQVGAALGPGSDSNEPDRYRRK